MFSSSFQALLAGGVFALLLGGVCVCDLRRRRIPNVLVLALAAGGLLFSAALTPGGVARGAGGLALGLAIWLPFYALRLLGAGDVKLFAAASAWLGPSGAAEGALAAALVGGALSLAWLIREQGLRRTADRVSVLAVLAGTPRSLRAALTDSHLRLPYAIALSIGAAVAGWRPGLLF
jgi:prepilin peptidase CpaA